MNISRCVILVFVASTLARIDAGTFRNLNFEDYSSETRRLEAWHLSNTLVPRLNETNLPYIPVGFPVESPYAGIVNASLIGSATGFRAPGFEGNYALEVSPAGTRWPWILRQTGDIPSDAKSLSFALSGSQFGLRINDQDVPLAHFYNAERAQLREYFATVFADVSAFAGQTVELEFTTLPISAPFNRIDNIAFSPLSAPQIPEPSTIAFWVLGGLALAVTRFKTSTRR